MCLHVEGLVLCVKLQFLGFQIDIRREVRLYHFHGIEPKKGFDVKRNPRTSYLEFRGVSGPQQMLTEKKIGRSGPDYDGN